MLTTREQRMPPNENFSDKLHLAVRVAISAIPVVGGPALELFNALKAPPIQRRRDAWLDDLAERLSRLEQRGQLTLADLRDDEKFVSAVIQALTIAIKNHQQEKLEALHNAVINVALGTAPEDSKRELFLRLVDDFTILHLRALAVFRNHDTEHRGRSHIRTSVREIAGRLRELLPELREQEALAELVVDDLCRSGVLFWYRDGIGPPIAGLNQVTALGDEFMKFISVPVS